MAQHQLGKTMRDLWVVIGLVVLVVLCCTIHLLRR